MKPAPRRILVWGVGLQVAFAALLFGISGAITPLGAQTGQAAVAYELQGRYIGQPVDWMTWCGDCVVTDYRTGKPWVVNPGGCLWDGDDWYRYAGNGDTLLPANTTLAYQECRWTYSKTACGAALGCTTGTAYLHTYGVISSASPDLAVTEAFTWAGGSKVYTIPATSQGNGYEYRWCITAPWTVGGTVVTVPNSNDGKAIYQLITTTISNPTQRDARKTGGWFTTDYRGAYRYCPSFVGP